MKRLFGVFIVTMMLIACAPASDYRQVNTEMPPTEMRQSIPYESIKQLAVGEYCIFNFSHQKAKVIRVKGGYLFIVATSEWSDSGITSTFVPLHQF